MNIKQLHTTQNELNLAWKRTFNNGANNAILVALEAAQSAVQAEIDSMVQGSAIDALLAENNLTENEYKVLELSLNYSDREGQLSDNYSNFDVPSAMSAIGGNAQAVGGVVSSLVKKGLMFDDEEGMVWLSDKGVNAAFNVLEVA